ncbi:DUF4249 family protein [Mucilaginibacter sp.]|uniref:DUF4249 family protein n=1 Tax=Mucilaginibacter sp. TaxID=1882438 RepID=UPI0025D82771|nr:DUF4249 family protein [Mucilaginibacter sp.]
MKTLKTIFILFVVACAAISCTKTITPVLPDNGTQLVIEGVVSDTTGPYHVNISKTVNFYADNVDPSVSGATVTITDVTSGITDNLSETSAGVYTTHTIVGAYGHLYRMTAFVNGKTYTATSTMPQLVKIDSVSFDYSDKKQIRPVAWYQDPAQFTNYYKYSLTVNDVRLKRFSTFEDRLSNGRYIRDKADVDTMEIKNHNVVKFSLVGIDVGAYTFLSEAADVAYNNSSLAAPATPVSNISGGCVGYFSAQTVSSATGTASY